DLARSGLFRLVDPSGIVPRPTRAQDVRIPEFRARGADAIVVGSMLPVGEGRVDVRFALVDAVKQVELASMSYVVTPQQFRATAHKIADVIYEKITGDIGVFSTRIAYISKQGSRFQLQVADADGFGPQTIVTSNEPLLSPRWSPDGTRIAYVSLENRKPVVYIQSLSTGQRHVLANFRGSNSSPAWAPDGRRHADQGWQLADLHDQCGRQRCAAPDDLQRHRHRGEFHAGRTGPALHVRPRRIAADLPSQSRQRCGRAPHVRRWMERVTARSAGRQVVRLHA